MVRGQIAMWVGLALLGVGCGRDVSGARVDGWTETEATLESGGPTATLAASATTGPAPLSIYFDGTRSRPAADG